MFLKRMVRQCWAKVMLGLILVLAISECLSILREGILSEVKVAREEAEEEDVFIEIVERERVREVKPERRDRRLVVEEETCEER